MNLVLIADGHPREWPILEAINRHFPDSVWIHPTYSMPDPLKNGSSTKRAPWNKRLSNIYRQLRDRVRRQITKRKVGRVTLNFSQEIKLPYFELGRERGLQLLDKLNPDVIVTCRAPILSPKLLQKANWCAINVHFGLVPDYRGNEGLFWAAKKKDTDSLGGSIHFLEDGVDTGHIIADALPKLTGRESETTLELKVSEVLSRTLVECLQSIAEAGKAPKGKPQGRIGRNYRGKERTFTKDLVFFINRVGQRLPAREEQKLFY